MRDSWRLRDVTHDERSSLPRLHLPAGYLLLIRDVELSGRYRAELTEQPDMGLAQLRESLPVKTEIVIIMRSEDIKATEFYFQLLFEESWKWNGWFELDDVHVGLIRRMVALQNPDSIYYADKIPLASWDEQPMTRLTHSRLWSLPPEDYRSMPTLESPAGYICVLRDARGSLYRIQYTASPREFVDDLICNEALSFGLELIAILGTDYVRESETYLHDKYGAALGEAWMAFDEYQVEQLKDSALQTNKHGSCYIFPD